MSEEKSFCELLTEQIIDEKKAVEIYKRLQDLLDEEKNLLYPNWQTDMAQVGELTRDRERIGAISEEQSQHAESLKLIKKYVCGMK